MNFVQNWEKIQFAEPLWLILLCILPVIAWAQNKAKFHNNTLFFSNAIELKDKSPQQDPKTLKLFLNCSDILLSFV